MIVFGSFVTAKAEPKDVDVVLVMRDDFDLPACPPECAVLFDHRRADDELGASDFWVRSANHSTSSSRVGVGGARAAGAGSWR